MLTMSKYKAIPNKIPNLACEILPTQFRLLLNMDNDSNIQHIERTIEVTLRSVLGDALFSAHKTQINALLMTIKNCKLLDTLDKEDDFLEEITKKTVNRIDAVLQSSENAST